MSSESSNHRWVRDSIEPQRQPEGGRNLAAYELALGFSRNELNGKRVLDLGVGPEAKLAKELTQAGIDADVVGVSPDVASTRHRARLRLSNPDVRAVAGLGQELPFRDESFDIVFALHLVDHIDTEENFKRIIKEVIRVLKQGGVARIGPLFIESSFNSLRLIRAQAFIDMLSSMNVEVREEEISDKYGKERLYDESGMGMGFAPYFRLVIQKLKMQNLFNL